jgi:hypothetical protein
VLQVEEERGSTTLRPVRILRHLLRGMKLSYVDSNTGAN